MLVYFLLIAALVTGVVWGVEHVKDLGRNEQKAVQRAQKAEEDTATAKELAAINQQVIDDADAQSKLRYFENAKLKADNAKYLAELSKLGKSSVAWLDAPVDPDVRRLRRVRFGESSNPVSGTGLVLRPPGQVAADSGAPAERREEPRLIAGSERQPGRADPVQQGQDRRTEIINAGKKAEESILERSKLTLREQVNSMRKPP